MEKKEINLDELSIVFVKNKQSKNILIEDLKSLPILKDYKIDNTKTNITPPISHLVYNNSIQIYDDVYKLIFKRTRPDNIDELFNIVSNYLECNDKKFIKAVGINFIVLLYFKSEELFNSLIEKETPKIIKNINFTLSGFSYSFSKNYDNYVSNIRMDTVKNSEIESGLRISFNYHFEINHNDDKNKIDDIIHNWKDYKVNMDNMINTIFKE